MEESSYKHNYEYLSIEEAKSIISGTFVQGTTNIGGELVTKSDIDKLLTASDKRLTSMVPSTVASNEFVCFFECINNEEFPDDEAHRWIEITPTNAGNFTEAGGTITVTGSYGLKGSFGTKKTVGWINDTITVEKNTTTQTKSGSKTYYYDNDSSQAPTVEVRWTQSGRKEVFTYEYHIYVGLNNNSINKNFVQLVWQNDQHGQSSKKYVYVKAFKDKINEQGETVSTESVEYIVKDAIANKFSINTTAKPIECYPLNNNLSDSNLNTGSFIVYIKDLKEKQCKVNLIQERKGIQVISGDAVEFEYSWDNLQQSERYKLFQATTVGLNNPNESYKDYCGYFSGQFPEYKNITHWLGTNPGKPEGEHVLIEFGSIDNYLKEHGNNQSSIAGKTILESLTDNNGVITATCNAYTNWWGKRSENITLLYSVYHKDSEDVSVKTENGTFVLTGYSKIKSTSDQALCFATGSNNSVDYYYKVGPTRTHTLSAKFTYYLNSGIFALQTNKDNVGKWQKGLEWNFAFSTPSCSNVNFKNDGVNIIFSASIDSLHQPDNINKNLGVRYTIGSTYGNISKEISNIKISDIPHKIAVNTPLDDVVKEIDFGEESSVIMAPSLNLNKILDYDIPLELNFNTVYFKNQITVYKPR